jgi:hypothetical protein
MDATKLTGVNRQGVLIVLDGIMLFDEHWPFSILPFCRFRWS